MTASLIRRAVIVFPDAMTEFPISGGSSLPSIGALHEGAEALGIVLGGKRPGGDAGTITACAGELAVFGPHRPIAAADADRELVGHEVGQHDLRLHPMAAVGELGKEGWHVSQM